MTSEAIWTWLWGEAGAAWIGLAVTLLIVIWRWWRRERPPRVIVQEVSEAHLLITPSQHTLRVLYQDSQGGEHEIKDLWQKQIVIYNSGDKDITGPIELTLDARPATSDTQKPDYIEWYVQGQDHHELSPKLELNLPYLNSYKIHGSQWNIRLLSETKTELSVTGDGPGWSSYYIKKNSSISSILSDTIPEAVLEFARRLVTVLF